MQWRVPGRAMESPWPSNANGESLTMQWKVPEHEAFLSQLSKAYLMQLTFLICQ